MLKNIIDYPPHENDFITFRKFDDEESASELAGMLKENGISAKVEDTSGYVVFGNNEVGKEFRVKLRQSDFPAAQKFLIDISSEQVKNVESDYYLFSFSDEELMEIIEKSDEWSEFDFVLAKKLLKDRGHEINNEFLSKASDDRMKELAKPESSHPGWITFGYLSAFLGGAVGIFMGWHLLTHKKTLPGGQRIYAFSNSDRKHGNRIFIIGIVSLVVWIIWSAVFTYKW